MKRSLGSDTLAYPAPVFIVGSYDPEGKPNLMAIAWGGICSSQPPSIAISAREATHTHGNIRHSQAFTVNIPSPEQAKEADYTGIYSGRNVDKFAAAGLTAVKSNLVNAPYIGEFPLVLECKLIHTFALGLHTQFVGEIMDVKAEEAILDAEGKIDIDKLEPLIFAPGRAAYYRTGAFLGDAFSIGKQL